MFVHKYNFLLQILSKLKHTCHDFIATKTCRSYEFLVVFGQLLVLERKSALRCRAGAGKISQIPAGARRSGFKFCGCGAGADKQFQPAQDSSVHRRWLQQVDKFKYLGVLFTSDGRWNKEMYTLTNRANVILREHYCSVVKKQELSITGKLSVFKFVFVFDPEKAGP